jgi:hypothetical protein
MDNYPQKVREVLTRYYMPKDQNASPIAKQEAIHAIECMVAIACLFKAMETCEFNLVCNSFINLLWGLEHNKFWKQNYNELLPLIKMGFHSYVSALQYLQHNKDPDDEIKLMVLRNGKIWQQIFAIGLNCLYGHNRMFDDANVMLLDLNKVL